jgi:hypothetical protein
MPASSVVPTSSIVIAIIGVIGLFIFLRWMKTKGFGVDCWYCGGNARFLDRVNTEDRASIKKYFHTIEDRVPWPDTILVCDKCKRVYETQASRPRASGIKCKVCERTSKLTNGKCLHCGAPHEWVSISEYNGYRFLVPTSMGFGGSEGDGTEDVRAPSAAERANDD